MQLQKGILKLYITVYQYFAKTKAYKTIEIKQVATQIL